MRIEKKGIGRRVRALGSVLILLAGACGASEKSATARVVSANSGGQSESTQDATSAATGQTTPAGTESTGKRARVVILGTSLTAGLGLDPSDAYPALLQRMADSAQFDVSIVNAGLSGETSAGALRRSTWVLDQPADAVVLEVGANDGLRGVDPDSTQANIEALVDVIQRKYAAAKVVLVQMEAPPNFGTAYTTRFRNAYAGAARSRKIELLPFLLDSVAGVSALNQGDGVHPNKNGSRVVARNMFRALTPLFVSLSSAATNPTN